MGGGPHGLAVGRPVAFDAVQIVRLRRVSKESRALVLILALAELLSRSGERIAWPGLSDPFTARNGAERLAANLAQAAQPICRRPDLSGIRRFSDIVIASDFLDPVEETMEWLDVLARHGVRAHLIEVADPAEESFPYAGRTEFSDPETGEKLTAGRAELLRPGLSRRSTPPAARRCRHGPSGWAGATRSTTPTGSPPRRWFAVHMAMTADFGPGGGH